MYTPLRRMTIVTALAIALVTSAMSSSAVARPPDLRTEMQTSSLAGTTAQDFRTPDGASATDAARREQIALAQERYYSSYGEPEPLPAAEPAAPVDDPEPLLPIAVATAALLTIVGASVTLARRRRRVAV